MEPTSEVASVESSSGSPWIVVGLGNPGARYARTRHNLGFRLVDRLEEDWGLRPRAQGEDCTVSRHAIEGRRILLARPLTWMNRSGAAVGRLLREEGAPVDRLLVCVDDVNLPLGALRLRPGGSAGGHNGLRSIEERLGDDGYARLRMGCGPAPAEEDLADFVLAEFAQGERDAVGELLERAARAVRCWFLEGTEIAMSRFNGRGG